MCYKWLLFYKPSVCVCLCVCVCVCVYWLHTWSHCRGVWSTPRLISVFPAPVPQPCGIQTSSGWTCWPPAAAWPQTVSGWRCSGWRCCSPPHPAPCRTRPVQTDPSSQASLRWCCRLWWWWSPGRWPPPSLRSQWRRWRSGQRGMRRSPLSVEEPGGLLRRWRRAEEAAGALGWLGCLLCGRGVRPWWRSSWWRGGGRAHLRRCCLPRRSPSPPPARPGTACSPGRAGCPYCAALSPLRYAWGGCHPQTPLCYWGCPHLQPPHPSQLGEEEEGEGRMNITCNSHLLTKTIV